MQNKGEKTGSRGWRAKAAKIPLIGKKLEGGPKVPVVRLSGVISDMARRQAISYAKCAKMVEKAFDKPNAAAVVLIINSPGGAPAQSSLIAGLVRQLAAEKDIPVYAFIEDVAASGGYWLACAGDYIHAQETSIVGSIGVISAGFGFEDFIEKYDIHRRLHTSGGQKSFLDPFRPEKEEDVRRLKIIQEQMHESFIAWVRERRGARLNGTDETLFDGQFWTGPAARDHGLIDGIGDVRGVMRAKFGENVKLLDIAPEKKLPFPLSLLKQEMSLTDDLMETLESRALYNRLGL